MSRRAKNFARMLTGVMIIAAIYGPNVSAQTANFCPAGQDPQFNFGFATLKAQVGDAMGDASECEHTNPENGDSLQRTTSGLSFYRKSTNTPTFTNGSDHWGLADGLLTYWTGTSIDQPGVALPTTSAPTSPLAAAAPSEADIAARVAPSVVQVLTADGAGSGVSVAAGVITNEHVVHGTTRVELFTSDGRRFGATVQSTDLTRDLALLVPDLKLPTVAMESAAAQRQGDQLLVLGYPRPSILGVGGPASLTRGLLSAIRQEDGVTYIQTDATINHGNSGGPVLNMRGNVVGVVDFTLKDSVGLNFAIATESIEGFLAAPAAIAQSPDPARNAPAVPTPAAAAAPAPPRYHGDPRGVIPEYGIRPMREDISALQQGRYTAVFPFPTEYGPTVATVTVWPTEREADADLISTSGVGPGVTSTLLGAPCRTYLAAGKSRWLCRAKNVAVRVEGVQGEADGPYDWGRLGAGQIIEKVNSLAR